MTQKQVLKMCVCSLAASFVLGVAAQEHIRLPRDDVALDAVVVRQGDTAVVVADVDAYLQKIPEKDRAGVMESPERIESIVTNLLRIKALAKDARAKKLDEDESVKHELDLAQDEVLARRSLDIFASQLKLPDFTELAKEQFLAQKKQYATPPIVEVQHVLIKVGPRTDAEAKSIAEMVRQKAVANPASFDALVKEYSEDPSKSSNLGHMKDASSSRFAKEFAEAAGAMRNPNQISPPVQTKFGYHVLKLINYVPGRQQNFDEVKADLIASFQKAYIDDQKSRYVNGITSQKVEDVPDVVAALRVRYLEKGELTPQMAAEKAKLKATDQNH